MNTVSVNYNSQFSKHWPFSYRFTLNNMYDRENVQQIKKSEKESFYKN